MDKMALQEQLYSFTSEESDRISILKLWLCIMVVFIHSSTLSELYFVDKTVIQQIPAWLDWVSYIISRVISQCAVPWFFFLSGMLLYRKPFRWFDNIKKKTRTLFIPYLILNTFWIVFYAIAQHIPAVSVYFANPDRLVSNYNALDFADAYLGFQTEATRRKL